MNERSSYSFTCWEWYIAEIGYIAELEAGTGSSRTVDECTSLSLFTNLGRLLRASDDPCLHTKLPIPDMPTTPSSTKNTAQRQDMSVILVTGSYDHEIRFWEAWSGICSRTIARSGESGVRRSSFFATSLGWRHVVASKQIGNISWVRFMHLLYLRLLLTISVASAFWLRQYIARFTFMK